MAGPLALFAVDQVDGNFTRTQVMGARQQSQGSNEWQVKSATGTVTFKPFPAIGEEKYRLYQEVGS
jgi:hypothetical protein